jgi:hypothetical protein
MSSVVKRPSASVVKKPTPMAAAVKTGVPCGKRSVKDFQKFIKIIQSNPGGINILLARALLNDDLLDVFDGHPAANECVFSYPNSDWYSVYLIDEDGNKVWDPEEGFSKLYFKIDVDGDDANIVQDSMTNITPDELLDADGNEIENCKIGASRACMNPLSRSEMKAAAPKAPAKPKAGAAKAPEVPLVSPSLRAELQPISVGTGAEAAPKGPKGKITRDYFEQLKSKELIVNWMIENMSREDLVRCLEKGAVSASDIASAEALASMQVTPDDEVLKVTPEIEKVVRAARGMNESVFKAMLKKVTKSTIAEKLNAISDTTEKKNAIVDLCTRSGISGYSVRANKKGVMKIIDPDDEPIDEGDIKALLDTCAESESVRLKKVIDGLKKQYAKSSVMSTARERIEDLKPKKPTLQSIIGGLAALSLDDKKNAIVEICVRNGNPGGYSAKPNKKGVLKIFDADGDPVDDGDIDRILEECAKLELVRVSGFGRYKRAPKGSSKRTPRGILAFGKVQMRKCNN